MRCPKCKGSVPDKITIITCPSCGAPVRRIPLTTDVRFAVQVMAERNGWVFWMLLSLPLWILFSIFQAVFGDGTMAHLFDDYLLVFFIHCFFTGLVVDLLMKTNAFVMRIAERATLKRAPLHLRRFRLGTNLAAVAAIFLTAWFFNFRNWASGVYMASLLSVLLIGIWWSWFPFIMNLEDMNDRRIADFFYEFSMDDLGRWRRMSLWVMGVYIFGGMVFAYMVAVPGAYHWLTQSDFIQFIISRAKMMFFWIPNFVK